MYYNNMTIGFSHDIMIGYNESHLSVSLNPMQGHELSKKGNYSSAKFNASITVLLLVISVCIYLFLGVFLPPLFVSLLFPFLIHEAS